MSFRPTVVLTIVVLAIIPSRISIAQSFAWETRARPVATDFEEITGVESPTAHADTEIARIGTDTEGTVWWEARVRAPIFSERTPLPITLDDAMRTAIDQAPELRALQNEYAIRSTEVLRQTAAFDWSAFVDTIWNRTSDPVGTLLDGTPNRLRTRAWNGSAGIRRRNRLGGELNVSNDSGFLNSNSAFITPNNQGTARLGVRYEQPLLRGAGRRYNESPIGLAVLDREISRDGLEIGTQDYLIEVANAYWTLVLARGLYVQLVRSRARATATARTMEDRVNVDVRPNQLNRVRTEVTQRQADLTAARYDVLRFQERLLRLVLGPRYVDFAVREVLTLSSPPPRLATIDPNDAVETGLRYRSEMHQAIRRIRSACTELGIAENEVRPVLNLVLSTYVAGLRGNANIPGAWVDQFTLGEPGAGAGFRFEYPLGNRAAQAVARQRHLNVARFRNNLQQVIGQVTLEVREQVMETNKHAEVTDMRFQALELALTDLWNLQTRKRFLVDGSQVADLYLEDILRSQQRLQQAEYAYLDAQIRRVLAWMALSRATGTLCARENVANLADQHSRLE